MSQMTTTTIEQSPKRKSSIMMQFSGDLKNFDINKLADVNIEKQIFVKRSKTIEKNVPDPMALESEVGKTSKITQQIDTFEPLEGPIITCGNKIVNSVSGRYLLVDNRKIISSFQTQVPTWKAIIKESSTGSLNATFYEPFKESEKPSGFKDMFAKGIQVNNDYESSKRVSCSAILIKMICTNGSIISSIHSKRKYVHKLSNLENIAEMLVHYSGTYDEFISKYAAASKTLLEKDRKKIDSMIDVIFQSQKKLGETVKEVGAIYDCENRAQLYDCVTQIASHDRFYDWKIIDKANILLDQQLVQQAMLLVPNTAQQ